MTLGERAEAHGIIVRPVDAVASAAMPKESTDRLLAALAGDGL